MLTVQQIFATPGNSPFPTSEPARTLLVKANGGSVTIEFSTSSGPWITAVSADSANVLDVAGYRVRLTPVGGATYSLR